MQKDAYVPRLFVLSGGYICLAARNPFTNLTYKLCFTGTTAEGASRRKFIFQINPDEIGAVCVGAVNSIVRHFIDKEYNYGKVWYS